MNMEQDTAKYCSLIKEHIYANYKGMFREPVGPLTYRFLVPGSEAYPDCLWDWDSYWADVSLHQIISDIGTPETKNEILDYGKGCILNFLAQCQSGWMPIVICGSDKGKRIAPESPAQHNLHKPILAQHAAFLVRQMNGDAEWLREMFPKMQQFLNLYRGHFRNRATGLYFWANDCAIGVDNDPCTFGRPDYSSASIYLNSMIFREFNAMAYVADCLRLDEVAATYRRYADEVGLAVHTHCYDPWLGFFFSCDLNLTPRAEHTEKVPLHFGLQREWDCLIMRIGVWSGFLPLWSGLATAEEAKAVAKYWSDEKTFCAPYGIRTLSKQEKMYSVVASNNPSNWLGPIWIICNYAVWRGMLQYGFTDEAKELAAKTVRLLGHAVERYGSFHEYYQPENGEPVSFSNFQNWNYLVLNMIADLEGRPVVTE